jgi:hypothetical protein
MKVSDVTVTSPNSATGTITATLTITLSAAQTTATTINWKTIDGTATVAGNDYVAVTNGAATIAAGATSVTITVTIKGSTVVEPVETFWVQLTNISNSAINLADGFGVVTINSGVH